MDQTINQLHQRVISFQEEANRYLERIGSSDDRLFYGGYFYTGDLGSAQNLLLSINPGFFAKDWGARQVPDYPIEHPRLPISYLHEDYKLARMVRAVIFGDSCSMVERTAESFFYSPFASPEVAVFEHSLNQLTQELREEHQEIVNSINRLMLTGGTFERIILIGVSTYDSFIRKAAQVELRFVEEDSAPWLKTMDGKRRLFRKVVLSNGCTVLTSIHLSGAQIASADIETLKRQFELEMCG